MDQQTIDFACAILRVAPDLTKEQMDFWMSDEERLRKILDKLKVIPFRIVLFPELDQTKQPTKALRNKVIKIEAAVQQKYGDIKLTLGKEANLVITASQGDALKIAKKLRIPVILIVDLANALRPSIKNELIHVVLGYDLQDSLPKILGHFVIKHYQKQAEEAKK